MTQNGTCPAHENVILKINTLEQRSNNMAESISNIRKNDLKQSEKIDKISEQMNSMVWKIVGSVGALITIVQIIIQFVK